MDNLKDTSSNDLLPLLTSLPPEEQRPVAAHLSTASVPISAPNRLWRAMRRDFMSSFEPTPIEELLIHTALCFGSFPFVYLLCMQASGMTLFWSRAIVGAVCGAAGLALGHSVIKLSQRGLESALWATVIHESVQPHEGITIDQLDSYVEDRGNPMVAARLFFGRTFHHKGAKREFRRRYDQTPWSLPIVLFFLSTVLAASLAFIFGRIVEIYTKQERQLGVYYDTSVIGDLSREDIERASNAYDEANSRLDMTWPMVPFSSAHIGLIPTGRSFTSNRLRLNPQARKNVTDTVWFAETYPSQLAPDGLGFGTFGEKSAATALSTKSPATESRGQVVRWPRWGIRIECTTLVEQDKYLIPVSGPNNMTYLFIPKATLHSVFESMGISYPTFRPINFTALMDKTAPPAHISEADIALAGKWWDNGVTHSFWTTLATRGDDGTGWVVIDVVLVRLNQSYAPDGFFETYAYTEDPYPIGYDVAICVEEFKPYMLETYNNTASSPWTLGILHSGLNFDGPTSVPLASLVPNGVQWGINSTGKLAAFGSAHFHSRNTMLRDNGRDLKYSSNPTVVSFTNGSGVRGYTKLDPNHVANVLAKSDFQYLLPYLVGSQAIVARVYPDQTVAYIKIYQPFLALLLLVILLLGYVAAIFVPRLPLGLPRRDFGVYSWLAAIEGDAILKTPTGVGRHEHLNQLRRREKHTKVRYDISRELDWNSSAEHPGKEVIEMKSTSE